MKLFNVTVNVEITEIGALDEPSLTEKLKGSPLGDMAEVLKIIAPSPPIYPGSKDGMTMRENVQVAVASFEQLQKLMQRFHETAQSLQGVS